jgi:hypothetical protein
MNRDYVNDIQTGRSFMQRPFTVCCNRVIGAWIGALVAAYLLTAAPAPAIGRDRTGSMVNCDIQKGACEKIVAGTRITLEIHPRPVKAMRDLTFKVTVADFGKLSASPYIDLNMPAMDMGPNQVALKDLGEGVFEGRGVIVRCRSGRKTWRARIVLPNLGRADFVFDVVH